MQFKWDLSEQGFCPDVGRAIWGEPEESPRQPVYQAPVEPTYISGDYVSRDYRPRETYYAPPQQAAPTAPPVSHVYAPQNITQPRDVNVNRNPAKDFLYTAIAVCVILITVNILFPEVIPQVVERIGALI